MSKSNNERAEEKRIRDRALGRKRCDIPMTDEEKVKVRELLKKMRLDS